MRTCKACGEEKALDRFVLQRGRRLKTCKACSNRHNRELRAAKRDQYDRTFYACKLRLNYGITWQDYEVLLSKQLGLCAICGKPETTKKFMSVDHCHTSGRVRGLLCTKCNLALGMLGDDRKLLLRAARYLREK